MSNPSPKFLPPTYQPPPPTKPDPLAGCLSKIERTHEHIRDLERRAIAYSNDKVLGVGQYFDEDTKQIVFYFDGDATPPPQFSIVIGEAIHQLRSALDHLVHALFIDRGMEPGTKTQFPIFYERQKYDSGFNGQITGKSASLCGSARTRIDRLQPVHRGASAHLDPLAVLAKMDNTDKHRLLLVSGLLTAGCEIAAKDPLFPQTWMLRSPLGPIVVENRTEFLRHKFVRHRPHPTNPKKVLICPRVEVEAKLTVAIAVQNMGSGQYEPALPLLMQLSDFVRDLIEGFRSEF